VPDVYRVERAAEDADALRHERFHRTRARADNGVLIR